MPTYEYQCVACGVVEVQQSMKDATLTVCPQCKKRKVTRIISGGGGVIFKGDGFWETDYNRSKDYAAKAKSEADKPATTPIAAPPPAANPSPTAAPTTTDTPKPKPKPPAKPSTDGDGRPASK